MLELMLLNAVIQTRNFGALVKHGLNDQSHFRDQKCAYQFIEKHLGEFGELPSIESVITNCPDFEDVDVVESIDTLCLKLIERNLKLDAKSLLQELAAKYGELDGYQMLDKLRTFAETATRRVSRGSGGANWATDGERRFAEYQERKRMDYGKNLPAMFDDLTEMLGGYERGDVITIMAFTGKGKSWMGFLSALAANRSGYNVLIESCEMTKPKVEFRLDTLEGGFSNRGLWNGDLADDAESQYAEFTQRFTRGNGRADLVIHTPEDWPQGLTLQQLSSDIDRTGCDMVVIDQFNLMRFNGASKEAKADFSRSLKQLAARKKVVIIMLYQTNGDYEKSRGKDDDGVRELKLPQLSDYSETIALIQDSSIIYGFDAVRWKDETTGRYRGKAILGVLKSRDGGGEGEIMDLEWLPNDGVIRPRQPMDIF